MLEFEKTQQPHTAYSTSAMETRDHSNGVSPKNQRSRGNFLMKISLLVVGLTILPFMAKAQFGGGDGSAGNPYIINTAEHLALLATYVNANTAPYVNASTHYKLNGDISLSAAQWTPIGNSTSRPFRGNFDGNGKKVTNLKRTSTIEFSGLFGVIASTGTVKNVGIEADIDVSAPSTDGACRAGAVAGRNDGTVENCYSAGFISTYSGGDSWSIAGGLVGLNYATIKNCYSTATVNASSQAGAVAKNAKSHAGGIAGRNTNGTMSYCYSISQQVSATATNTSVAAAEAHTGGIVGSSPGGTVFNCVALCTKISSSGSTYNRFGRVVGFIDGGSLSSNSGFVCMLNPSNGTTWNYKGAADRDGVDISASTIHEDGTLENRFVTTNGWTVQNGKLPGLFGNTVDMPSHLAQPTAPTNISGTTTICSGQCTILTATGGSIGNGCTYQWGTGTCGSNIISGQTNSSINVCPTENTTYWVRRTGNGPCSTTVTTSCATVTITVNTPPTAPTSISGTKTITSGQSTTLTAEGGSVGSGATYQWGTGDCGSNIISGETGISIKVEPTISTTYWVRRIGTSSCNNTTDCATTTVTVQYTITPSSGENGSISPSEVQTVNYGENKTFTFTPATCYKVAQVTVNDAPVTVSGNDYTIENVTKNTTIHVTFEKILNTITVSANPPAGGTATGGGTFDCGDSKTVTANANDGYKFVNWTKDGSAVSTANPYTFTVTENIELVANFAKEDAKVYQVTVSVNNEANGTANGGGTYEENTIATVTATANSGYKFINWTRNGVEVSPNNQYSFTVTEDVELVANFEEDGDVSIVETGNYPSIRVYPNPTDGQ
ncbi:MAG: hypothetical protein FWF09_06720, partial [Bacteroidales bacterium]|nr:hypothetical protein [Bacteroidales bacterium]